MWSRHPELLQTYTVPIYTCVTILATADYRSLKKEEELDCIQGTMMNSGSEIVGSYLTYMMLNFQPAWSSHWGLDGPGMRRYLTSSACDPTSALIPIAWVQIEI